MDQYSEINIDKVCKKWAKAMKPDGHEFKFNFQLVKFDDSAPTFKTAVQAQSTPTTLIIFQDTFRNDTTLSQKHRIRCERHTTSHAQVNLSRALVFEEGTKLRLTAIPSHIASKSGFLNDVEVSQIKSHDFKEKLTWEVDDEIQVPPRSTVRAEVIVSEEEHLTEFQVKTNIRGNVHCDVIGLDGEQYSPVDGDIKEILEEYADKKEKELLDFSAGKGVNFISEGACKFRYAISKKVNVYTDED